jgi:hypothetical protein
VAAAAAEGGPFVVGAWAGVQHQHQQRVLGQVLQLVPAGVQQQQQQQQAAHLQVGVCSALV